MHLAIKHILILVCEAARIYPILAWLAESLFDVAEKGEMIT